MENASYQLDRTTKQIRGIRHKLIAELERQGVTEAGKLVIDECFEWARGIQKKYPETYRNVRSYYGMVTGNPPKDVSTEDFEGEDSAFLFLENLRKRLLKLDTV